MSLAKVGLIQPCGFSMPGSESGPRSGFRGQGAHLPTGEAQIPLEKRNLEGADLQVGSNHPFVVAVSPGKPRNQV